MSELNYDDLSMDGLVEIYKDAVQGGDQMTIDALHAKVQAWQQLGGEWSERAYEFLEQIKAITTIEQADASSSVARLVTGEDPHTDFELEGDDIDLPEHLRLGFPKPCLTLADLHDMVKSVEYHRLPDGRTTTALLHLRNGSTTVAHSQVLYAENNVPAYGDKAAYDNGIEKLWDIAGFKHYQDKYELERVTTHVLPLLKGDAPLTDVELSDISSSISDCSPAVKLLVDMVVEERSRRILVSPHGEDALSKTIQDVILPAITSEHTTLEQAVATQEAFKVVPAGVRALALQLRAALDQIAMGGSSEVEKDLVKVFMGYPNADTQEALDAMDAMPPHLRHMAQAIVGSLALIKELRKESSQERELIETFLAYYVPEDEASRPATAVPALQAVKQMSPPVRQMAEKIIAEHTWRKMRQDNQVDLSNFELTTRVNQAAGNVQDGNDAQLRKQGGIILDEVKELLAELHMDALFRFDFVRIARSLSQLYTDSEAVRDFTEIADAAHDAEQFLELNDYQQNVIKGELPEDHMPVVNHYKVRGELQDVLVTTYGLAFYLGVDADEDHREVSRANMSKFDSTMELALATQKKYQELGVGTYIRKTDVHWPEFQGAYYANICDEDVTGKDGKFYRKGKFLKSIRFEEPRYKPLLILGPDVALTFDDEPAAPLSDEGLKQYVEGKDYVEVRSEGRDYSTMAVAGEGDPKFLEAEGETTLDLSKSGITLHAPSYPGYFDDLRKSRENAEKYKATFGKFPELAVARLMLEVGYDEVIRMHEAEDQGQPITAFLSAKQIFSCGVPYTPDEVAGMTVGEFIRSYQERWEAKIGEKRARLREGLDAIFGAKETTDPALAAHISDDSVREMYPDEIRLDSTQEPADEPRDEDQPELSPDEKK